MTNTPKPVIGLITDMRDLGGMPFQVLGDKYAQAVAEFADAVPLAILTSRTGNDIERLLDVFDGFLFTGSPSNIRPHLYGEAGEGVGPFDDARDALSLPLIRAALARKMPCLFICRGLQELNVAHGGTLHTGLPDPDAHHSPEDAPYEDRYAPHHEVILKPGAGLDEVFGSARFEVNSLHYQALDRIGEGLSVAGTAPDGIPEVVVAEGQPFAIGVQWHPEFRPAQNAPNRALFAHFGQAARAWRAQK
ncbi:gamma-glutamyl-gamma-aminobutyrate hydrolase family protein [Acidocella sp.]|uniref:gamma-glutamyl-gamma-aminobutyrate hydrolase family protein n=1 Tax=Acidocella sp. TaxID=50710 RepID=UPI0026191A64|nr:gamma-glutamyl-gamma-aminobutyrate hydrolase family protein [Acidocella sp.]